jgi:hypothetical protein
MSDIISTQKKTGKSSHAFVCINNWKKREISKLSILKEDMIRMNEFDKESIDIYINLEYDKIINKYNDKIEKNNSNKVNIDKEMEKKRKKAINMLIESRIYLENSNIDMNYIKNKSSENYDKINTTFNTGKNKIKKKELLNIL